MPGGLHVRLSGSILELLVLCDKSTLKTLHSVLACCAAALLVALLAHISRHLTSLRSSLHAVSAAAAAAIRHSVPSKALNAYRFSTLVHYTAVCRRQSESCFILRFLARSLAGWLLLLLRKMRLILM